MTSLVETSLEEFVHELDVGTQAEVTLGLQTIVLDPVWGESFGPIMRLDDSSCAWDLYPFSFGRRQAEIIAEQKRVRLPASYEALVDDLVHGHSSLERLADILIEALSLVPEWRYNIYYRRVDTSER